MRKDNTWGGRKYHGRFHLSNVSVGILWKQRPNLPSRGQYSWLLYLTCLRLLQEHELVEHAGKQKCWICEKRYSCLKSDKRNAAHHVEQLPMLLTPFRALINLWRCCVLCQVECWMRSCAEGVWMFMICQNYRTLAIKYILNNRTKNDQCPSHNASINFSSCGCKHTDLEIKFRIRRWLTMLFFNRQEFFSFRHSSGHTNKD